MQLSRKFLAVRASLPKLSETDRCANRPLAQQIDQVRHECHVFPVAHSTRREQKNSRKPAEHRRGNPRYSQVFWRIDLRRKNGWRNPKPTALCTWVATP